MKVFFGFIALSGLGWLFDFGTFSLLVKFFDVAPYIANFISSYVGVSFVWFTSLKSVFKSGDGDRWRFLVIYWIYQFVSISVYSQLLRFVVQDVVNLTLAADLARNAGVIGKILVTPFNLITNFIFMKILVRFMRQQRPAHV